MIEEWKNDSMNVGIEVCECGYGNMGMGVWESGYVSMGM